MNSLEALRQSRSIYAEHRKLKIYSIAAALGVMAFLALSTLMFYIVYNIPPLRVLAEESRTFYFSVMTLVSVCSIGGPFLVVYSVIKRLSDDELLPFGRPRNAPDMALLTVAGFAACIGAGIVSSYFSAYVQQTFGVTFEYYADPAPAKAADTALYILAYAFGPALLEEFALRGVVMQPLRKYGDWFAILMSSLVFALMHGNMIQLPFAFLSGIAIGFAVIRSGTIWTGVLIHFLNNFSSVVQNIYIKHSSSGGEWVAIYLFYALILLVGGACALLYFRRVQQRERERQQKLYPFAFPPRKIPLLHRDRRFPAAVCVKKYVLTLPMLAAITLMVLQTLATITMGG